MRRILGWLAMSFVLLAFFVTTYSALFVRSAISDGALAKQAYGCIDPPHQGRLEVLTDRAFVRAIQQYHAREGHWPRGHQIRGFFATVGMHSLYSSERRSDLIMKNLESTPNCPLRS